MKGHTRRAGRVQKSVTASSANDLLSAFEESTHFLHVIKLFDMKEKRQCFLIFSAARSHKAKATAKSALLYLLEAFVKELGKALLGKDGGKGK